MKRTVPRTAAKHSSPSLTAYRGLASWVDIYDTRAWADPAATVRDMASHGVKTVFIETGNSRTGSAIFDPSGQIAFIRAAHARGMKCVAWYLPSLTNVPADYYRIAKAIGFVTPDGQRFDSFALDIESTAISSDSARNRALASLSARLRRRVGAAYPLGAIIPSPVGISKKAGYWDGFPYRDVARDFNVIVPMGYYTYHGHGAGAADADALGNIRILRAQPGCAKVPVHLIGGLADSSSSAEVAAFAGAARASGCIGASLYSWSGTTASDWKALQKAIR